MIQRPTTRRARLTVSFVSSEERSCGLSVCVYMQKMELRYWWEHGNVNLNSRLRLQFLLTNLSCSRRALQQNKAKSKSMPITLLSFRQETKSTKSPLLFIVNKLTHMWLTSAFSSLVIVIS